MRFLLMHHFRDSNVSKEAFVTKQREGSIPRIGLRLKQHWRRCEGMHSTCAHIATAEAKDQTSLRVGAFNAQIAYNVTLVGM